jgi:hypothetical protein
MAKEKKSEQGLYTFGHMLHSNCGIDVIEIRSDGTDIILRVSEYERGGVEHQPFDLSKPLDLIEKRIPLSRIGHTVASLNWRKIHKFFFPKQYDWTDKLFTRELSLVSTAPVPQEKRRQRKLQRSARVRSSGKRGKGKKAEDVRR